MNGIWTTDELIDSLAKTTSVLDGLLAGADDALAHARPAEGEWSAVETIGHLVDAEERAVARISQVTQENDPELAGYDADALVRERDYQGQPLDTVMTRFLALRAERIAALQALAPEQWQRTGIFMGRGATPLTAITVHMIWHDANHLAQIAQALALARG
jgi:uncharacterized damage-inducible protein DinB